MHFTARNLMLRAEVMHEIFRVYHARARITEQCNEDDYGSGTLTIRGLTRREKETGERKEDGLPSPHGSQQLLLLA